MSDSMISGNHMTVSVFDLFKIGIGPSSSHTVGPMKAARLFAESLHASRLLSSTDRIQIELFGSLGATGEGHGSKKAVLMGLEGERPESIDVSRIAERMAQIESTESLDVLARKKIRFVAREDLQLRGRESLPFHPNGMRFTAVDTDSSCMLHKIYFSIGGGFVVEEPTDSDELLLHDAVKVAYPFNSGDELLAHCDRSGLPISAIMMANELAQRDEKTINRQIDLLWETMAASIAEGYKGEGNLPGGLNVKRRAARLYRSLRNQSEETSRDQLNPLDWVSLYALSVNEVNAMGGRLVTAPTNGAAGIIPAVLKYYLTFCKNTSQENIRNFILTAGAIGALYKMNASISGAEVGCQGEVGSACSMAAGALTEVLGGTPAQVENAAEIAMEHNLGLTCDPIKGLVQIPCIERNAMAAIKAISAARMALRGDGEHYVSLDQVIKTMRDTGRDMQDKYKETATGGLAINVLEVPVSIIEC